MAEITRPPTVTEARSALANSIKYDRNPETVAAARADLETAKIVRAIDDPATLARAAQIVRTALARQRLTLADLDAGPAG